MSQTRGILLPSREQEKKKPEARKESAAKSLTVYILTPKLTPTQRIFLSVLLHYIYWLDLKKLICFCVISMMKQAMERWIVVRLLRFGRN
jgi:hypothetical protein